ncbi:type IV secretory system conjugative DNA transfer family protein (plasmid) [Rhizobium sp. CB3060]|uniref:type IV secretory system conjugative DNA transfer family protein n=1 Tax=Rhizobium sp. CB3060 TaxID=3138255 RepID=UPI0021A86CE1|nr:type IV secretory system conjugative DNA transfer family protein [Rhizobium tropici]UWU26025.1 type IV secretory system conjugative DNA transfer family protein [Rhizobium tropici]
MKRYEKIALIVAGPFLAAAALFFAWSTNYAAASFFLLKSTAMWKSFTTDDLAMPAKQAWVYLGNPKVRSLIGVATIATLVEATIATGGILLLLFRPWEVRPPGDGSRFATLKDLEKSGLTQGEPGKSILLGTIGNGKKAVDIRYRGDSHFFVNGPSRSGKGRGFVMTNLLEYLGSVVVLDVKLENFALTGAARLAMGQKCFVFAPGSKNSHRWNPLDFVRDWPERSTDLINLATTLLPIGEKEEGYWKQTARGLMASLIGYVLESGTMEGRRNLRSALRLFSTGKPFSEVLEAIIANEPGLNDFILAGFRQHLGRDEDQRPSFEGHIVTVLAPFNNLLMAEACAASDFDVRDLRRAPFSLFIASPVSDFGTVEPLIRLLIQQIHDVMLRRLPDRQEPHKILMMLDEFYQFERLPEIVRRAPLVAGYGLTIALVAQNIPQIDERYGQKTRDALIGNMDIKLFIAVGDETTARFVSTHLGRKYEEREGWGRNRGVLTSKTASQGRFELVPLMDPDAVQRLDDEKTILQIRSGYGAILNKLNFYTQDRFIARRRQVEPFARDLSIPEIVLLPEWPLFETRPKATEPTKAEQVPQAESAVPDHDAIVLTQARAVFTDPAALMHAYRHAIMAADDQAVADLLFRLRTAPETIAPLRGNRGRLDARGRQVRAAALDAVWPLRDAITAARWAAIAARLELTANGAELFFSPGTPLPPVPIGNEAEDDEDNRLELFFQDGSAVVAEIEELVDDDIDAGRAADAGALSRALVNLRTGYEQSMNDAQEVNEIRIAEVATARETL